MIILDSNVISELMRPSPELKVRIWLDHIPHLELWTTTINLLELRGGILMLPEGRRRSAMSESLDRVLSIFMESRILPFDLEAAEQSAVLASERFRRGINKETRDTQIAGIAISRNATLATRNVRDFADLDLKLVDPWGA